MKATRSLRQWIGNLSQYDSITQLDRALSVLKRAKGQTLFKDDRSLKLRRVPSASTFGRYLQRVQTFTFPQAQTTCSFHPTGTTYQTLKRDLQKHIVINERYPLNLLSMDDRSRVFRFLL